MSDDPSLLFRRVLAHPFTFKEPTFYNTSWWGFRGDLEKKVKLLLGIPSDRLKKALKSLPNRDLEKIFSSFKECHRKMRQEVPIVDYETLSRASQIQAFSSLFYGEEICLDQRASEKKFVTESTEEVKNIFITFTLENGSKIFHFPRHLFILILTFTGYNRRLLTVVGRVSKDFYLMILSSWPRITISQRTLFNISLLSLKNVREISFTKKSITLKKKELKYIWDHIEPSNIRVLDFGKCHGTTDKILSSISDFRHRRKGVVFDQCRNLILPTEKLSSTYLEIDPFWSSFPNITCLHLTSDQLRGIMSSFFAIRKFTRLREFHFTVVLNLFTPGSHNYRTNIPNQLGRILNYENIDSLHLTFGQYNYTMKAIDHKSLSSFLKCILEKFSQVEVLSLNFTNRNILGFSSKEIDIGDNLPRTLNDLSIRFRTRVTQVKLPINIPNPNCQKLKIFPLERKCVDRFCMSVFTWDPIPRHYEIGVRVDRSFSEGIDELIDLGTAFLSYISNVASFRLFTWSFKFKNVHERWSKRMSRGDRVEICFDEKEKKLEFKGSTLLTREESSDHTRKLKETIGGNSSSIQIVTIETGKEFFENAKIVELMFRVLLDEEKFYVVDCDPSLTFREFKRKVKDE